jgi:carboxyl-terminal processing protease
MMLRLFAVTFLAVFSLSNSVVGQLVGPRTSDRHINRVVAQQLQTTHVAAGKLDDIKSQRALKLFLKALDPMKIYFLQSDIAEFNKYGDQIDDMVRSGDMSVAYTIYRRYLERLEQRTAMAQQILDQPLNLDDHEVIVTDPDASQYPVNDAEARDRIRRQIEFSVLSFKDDKSEAGPIEDLKRRYRRLATSRQKLTDNDLLEIFLTSVTSSYDPHTTYMSPDSFDDFKIQMRLNLEGIGAALLDKDGYTVISKVIPGGAADKHGMLKAEDKIVSVGQGSEGPITDIVDMNLRDVVKLIRGPAGTVVRLGVKPGGTGETVTYSIYRAKVELEDSAARSQILTVPTSDGAGQIKVGYIDLPSFYMDMEAAGTKTDYRSGTRDVRLILEKFRNSQVDVVMMDLRVNGGGSLTEAISMTGLFIDRGPVVQVKEPGGRVQTHFDESPGTAWDGPLVVVTSKFSASASEIFAGAIQNYNRGLIVGDPATHGKGSVQTLIDLGEVLFGSGSDKRLGALKLTIQQYFLPSGESVQKRGVAADIILPSLTQHMDVGEGDMDYPLEYSTVPRAPHRVLSQTPPDVVTALRAQSAARVEKNAEFTDALRKIEIYRKQKEEKFTSLNKAEFEARRKEIDAQREEEKEILDQEDRKEVVFKRTYYTEEVLNIARDYVEQLRQRKIAAK